MKIQEVRTIARQWGINTRVGRGKADLIREIQMKEGNEPCFGTRTECDRFDCLWRTDCLKR